MSDLSEQEDDRYKCSRCGNVIHHKSKMDLYTFNSWCGRCGSDNGRHINYEVEEMTKEEAKEFIARSIKSDVDMAKVADAIKALEEPEWIPMVRREPTEEEKTEYLAQNGEELCYMLENEMPLHGQEVLVSIGEFVEGDIFDADFYNFENNDIENVDAWMPRPKPYKAESEE